MKSPLRVLLVVAAAYIAAQMLADISSLRIVEVFGFAVDGGTLVYPFTFTLRDLVHKIAGKKAARTVIVTAAGINVVMAGFLWIVGKMPADLATGEQLEFGAVFSSSLWRIVVASIVAEVISEFLDTEVYQKWFDRFGERMQWGRVLASNGIAVPVDSAIFVLIAFWGVLGVPVMWEVFWLNVVFKGVIGVASIPWIYLVRPMPVDAD